jgi:hypothetical protein
VYAGLIAFVAKVDLQRFKAPAADRREITRFKPGQGGVHSSFSG